jgi:hypothetical protein
MRKGHYRTRMSARGSSLPSNLPTTVGHSSECSVSTSTPSSGHRTVSSL